MKIVRYFFVGGTAALVDLALFAIGAKLMSLPYLPVAAGSFLVATLVNYFLSVRHVFESGVRFGKRGEIGLVFVVSAFGLAVNQIILWIAVAKFGVELIAAKLGATTVVFLWNYAIRRYYIFGRPKRESAG
jgi:putative flippase GtrA